MIKSNTKILFLCLTSLLLAITATLGTFFNSDGKNLIFQETVLLNPSYVDSVDGITLHASNSFENLSISRSNNHFIGEYEGVFFPVNVSKVHELVSLASTPTNAEFISDDPSVSSTYHVQEGSNQSKGLSFFSSKNNTETMLSKVYFGLSDFTGSRRYVRSAANSNIYLVPDSYYTFLQVMPSAWIDPKIFPDILQGNRLKNTISSLSLTVGLNETLLLPGDENFEEDVQTILSLQSSNVVPVSHIIETQPIAVVTVTYYDTYTMYCSVYNSASGYIFVPSSPQLLYGLDVSAWSFERLLEVFID